MEGELTVASAAEKLTGILSGSDAPEGGAPDRAEQTEQADAPARKRDERGKFQAANPDANPEGSVEEPQERAEEAQAEAEAGKAQETQEEQQELPETLDGLAEALGMDAATLASKLKHKVKVDGQEVEVNLAEALNGYSRDSDYRQKTAALAETRQKFEAEQTQWAADRQNTARLMLTVLENVQAGYVGQPPDRSMQETDLAGYLMAKEAYQERKAFFDQAVQQAMGVHETGSREQMQKLQQHRDAEAQKLVQKLPQLADEKRGAEERARVKAYLKSEGFTDQELANLVDSRTAVMAWKASQYDAIQKSKPLTEKKVAALPKFIRPGASTSKSAQKADALSQLQQRLRKSGSVDDAARLMKAIL